MGKRNPVKLVSAVVKRKIAVVTGNLFEANIPPTTISPLPIATRVIMTCKIVKAPTDIPRIMESPRVGVLARMFDFEKGSPRYTYISPCGLLRATPEELRLRLSISSFASRRIRLAALSRSKKARGRLARHEKGSNHGDRGIRILFHDPVPTVRDHAILHVGGGKAHHLGHSLSEGFLTTQSEHRHGEFTFGKKVLVVEGILVKGGKLHEPGMHGARHGIQTRVMVPNVFAEPAGRG